MENETYKKIASAIAAAAGVSTAAGFREAGAVRSARAAVAVVGYVKARAAGAGMRSAVADVMAAARRADRRNRKRRVYPTTIWNG